MKIKKNDIVVIANGKDRGKQGKVLRVDSEKDLIWVEGLNTVKKHQKPTQKNRQGGIIEKEAPINVSNVMFYDEKAGKPSRIGYKFDKSGKKIRYSKKSGEVISSN